MQSFCELGQHSETICYSWNRKQLFQSRKPSFQIRKHFFLKREYIYFKNRKHFFQKREHIFQNRKHSNVPWRKVFPPPNPLYRNMHVLIFYVIILCKNYISDDNWVKAILLHKKFRQLYHSSSVYMYPLVNNFLTKPHLTVLILTNSSRLRIHYRDIIRYSIFINLHHNVLKRSDPILNCMPLLFLLFFFFYKFDDVIF